jgi:hypothetical protein
MSTTAQTDLTTLQSQLVEVGDSLSNIEDAKTLKGAQSSAKTGVSRLQTAQGTLKAAIAALPPTPTPVPTPTPTPTPAPTPASLQPNGPAGSWTNILNAEFSGSLDMSVWNNAAGKSTVGIVGVASNVTVVNDQLVLTLSSKTQGAVVETKQALVKVGDCFEVSVTLPGSGKDFVNWCGLYTTTETSPTWHEVDCPEVLQPGATVNTHWPSGSTEDQSGSTTVQATAGVKHIFTAVLSSASVAFYVDSVLAQTLPYNDPGIAQYLCLCHGCGTADWNAPTQVGDKMLVDYVRAWSPA